MIIGFLLLLFVNYRRPTLNFARMICHRMYNKFSLFHFISIDSNTDSICAIFHSLSRSLSHSVSQMGSHKCIFSNILIIFVRLDSWLFPTFQLLIGTIMVFSQRQI